MGIRMGKPPAKVIAKTVKEEEEEWMRGEEEGGRAGEGLTEQRE